MSQQLQGLQEISKQNPVCLTLFSWQQIRKEVERIWPQKIFPKLFTQLDQQPKSSGNLEQITKQTLLNCQISKDKTLSKILQRSKAPFKQLKKAKLSTAAQQFSFNFDTKCCYQQTPVFKSLLQTPLPLFYRKYQYKIQQLSTFRNCKEKFKQIQINQHPLLFAEKPASFFIGIAMNLKSQNKIYQSLFFIILACYIQPFNERAWIQAIETLKKIGQWRQAYYYSKTAFLFNFSNIFAQQYLLCAQKVQVCAHDVRGLLTSLKRPETYQKIIVQSSKYEIKHRKIWRGFVLLNRFCFCLNLKNNLNYGIIILAKILQASGFMQGFKIIQKSIEKGQGKVQFFSLYFQMRMRINQGVLTEHEIQFLLQNIQNLTIQTKYKVPLMIGQALLQQKKNYKRSKQMICKAYQLVNKFCKNGIGKQRSFRDIFSTVICSLNSQPEKKYLQSYRYDQLLIFLSNRSKYIKGQPIEYYNFKDWKYYLHYSLVKDLKTLLKASQQHKQGRLMAQTIHLMRLYYRPWQIIKFWREKIYQMPKSGQLWCEGGRIFINLHDYLNAARCFEYAIHFTPQFGDSFIQLLKIYLITNHFKQINQLRKNFIISEPHYGNIFSFLQYYHFTKGSLYKYSLSQIWLVAVQQIKNSLYSSQFLNQCMLTGISSYNTAFKDQSSPQIREILFQSYQQMENKNYKF